MTSSIRIFFFSAVILALCAGVALSFVPVQGRGNNAATPAETGPLGVTVRGTVQNFVPVTDAILRNPAPTDWLMLRHDYSATSYSALDQITVDNVKTMRLAWMWPMREGGTNQPAPIVYNGTLYLA